jgi:4-hydroxy 2-oxovalerate aldolase
MNRKIKLLDCTLRDGGYYTNWDFDKKLVKKYLTYIEQLPIEYIEVGYRSNKDNGYFGEYFYLPIDTLKFIKQHSSKKLAIMLNVKEFYEKQNLDLLNGLDKYINLVRLATDPKKIDIAINLAKKIRKKGFNVAINVMYISSIDEKHIFFKYLDDIQKNVDILNLVDSYGSTYPERLRWLINKIKQKIKIPLGFHGHNNLELAFINSLESIKNGVDFIDSTVLGMGRGAGNLKTELILTHLNSKNIYKIDLNILSKLTEVFKVLLEHYNWGTNLAYIVSGSYSLPQKDVMEYLEINRYSMGGIIKKLKKETIELPLFKSNTFSNNNVIIIGGGKSVKKHLKSIKKFLRNDKLTIIHSTSKYINLLKNINCIQIFAIAGDELNKIDNIPKSITCGVTSPIPIKNNNLKNINCYKLENIDFTKYNDSPLSISLEISKLLNAKKIYLVGFDGYNKLKSKKELYLMNENQEIINNFNRKLIFLTPTNYKNVVQKSIYKVINEY